VSGPALTNASLEAPALSFISQMLAHFAPLQALRGDRSVELPVAGLPEAVRQLPDGELCLLLASDEATRCQLVRLLLGGSLRERRAAWVCAPGSAPRGLSAEVRQAAARRQLLTFSWTSEAVGQLKELGAAHLLRELSAAGMRPSDLLVLDAFDPWLAQLPPDSALEATIEQAALSLLRLAKAHRGPVLALGPAQLRGQSLLPLLAQSNLTHLAAIDLSGAAAHLDVLRWSAARRTRAGQQGERYALAPGDDGAWACRDKSRLDVPQLFVAADAQTTHVQRGALVDASNAPENWRVHASIESLLAAARDAVAATVVFAHETPEDVVALADAVYRLRREHPRLLKIIVRETGATLRKNGELALLRLGANAVIGRNQGFAHLVQVVAEVREQPFEKAPGVEPAAALQALAPDPIQGYLPLAAFCNAVERMLERTADTALEHSLVHVPLLPHVAHLDALLACQCRRDGDVVTAEAHGLTLFLFGCPPDDAMAALDALFSIPCSELARMVQIEPDGTSQRQALARLRRAADQSPLDFSTVLRGISPSRRPTPISAAVLPTRSADAARCVQAHVLPLRAAAA